MQEYMHTLHTRVVPHLGSQGIAIHLRHFNIGNHHQKFFCGLLAFIGHAPQIVERISPIIQLDDLNAKILQTAGDLLTRD